MFHNVLEIRLSCIQNSFLFIAEVYSVVWIFHSLFTCSFTEEHLVYFQFGALTDKSARAIMHRLSCEHKF